MSVYYNDNDAYCAQWLRNLIAAGHLPEGDVDERDIREVSADDLEGYEQCHFFAGIGGWPYTLELAGWPDGEPVWTGSCPCQPLSSAGQRKGHADERHLWPAFHRLVAERRPAVVLGEQVASKDGREWLAGVRADLEQLGYAVGAADLPAAGLDAPHIRQRLFWVADADRQRSPRQHALLRAEEARRREGEISETARRGPTGRLGDAGRAGLAQRRGNRPVQREALGAPEGQAAVGAGHAFWSAFDLVPCADGKARRVEPGSFPLAHGVPNRVGRLRAYGNAIVPQVAAEFVATYMECRP